MIGNFLYELIPIVLAVAILLFFWGLAMYLFNASDKDKRVEGVNIMFLAVVGIFLTVVFWGILNAFRSTEPTEEIAPTVPNSFNGQFTQ